MKLTSFTIHTGELHIWMARFSEHQDSVKNFLNSLSSDELRRAQRFRFQKDRDRFVIGRALLRSILSQYLELKAQEIQFSYNAFGRPTLHNSTMLNFNVSHSNDVMVVALANAAEIGVDVEYIRKDFENEDIADHYFSKSEAETFHSLPPSEKALAFYLCWTRKEAYIKANERGLSLPLKQFDVTLRPDEPAKLLRTTFDETERWNLFNLHPGENYAGAVATNAPLSNIQYFSI